MKAGCVVYLVVISIMCLYFPLTNQTLYVNVALGKKTYQTKTNYGGFSRLAVDGNPNPNFNSLSCSHSEASSGNNYWVVDLAQSYPIERIKITNRILLSERLRQFSIYVSNEDPLPGLESQDPTLTGDLCLKHPGPFPASGPHSVTCQSPELLQGRYVYVWKRYHGILTLCEFEVFVDSMYYSTLLPSEPLLHRGEISSKTSFFSSRMETFSRLACVGRCLLKQRREGSTLGLANLNGGNNACDWPVIKTRCYKDEL